MIKTNKKIIIVKLLFKPLNIILNNIFKKLNIFLVWRSGVAIGDQVLIAGLAKLIKKKFKAKVIVITTYPSLLSLSPFIDKCLSPKKFVCWKFFYYLLKVSEGERIIEYNFPYKLYGFKSHLDAYRLGFYKSIQEPPIWHAHVADRIKADFFKNFSGGLKKSNNSKTNFLKEIKKEDRNQKIGIINPSGKGTYTREKMYGFGNYQKIVTITSKKIKWIQVGKKEDPLLKNIYIDFRGESLDFLVDIIALSDLVLADEGLLNHIAGSFPKVNSYVTYSEFSPINYYSYPNTITIGIPKNIKNIKYWGDNSLKKYAVKPLLLSKEILKNEFLNFNNS